MNGRPTAFAFSLAAGLACLCPPGAQAAQRYSAESLETLGKACQNEVQLLCKRAPGQELPGCLKQYRRYLLPDCRKALKAVLTAPPPSAARNGAGEDAAQTLAAQLDARLTKVEGTVLVHTSKQAEGKFIPAEAGMPLAAGDLVKTGPDGKAEIALEGNSVVELDPGTEFEVKSLAPEDTRLSMSLGQLVAKIQTLLGGRKMEFSTLTAVAAIRGTELAVQQSGADQPSRIAVFDEGRVAVRSLSGGGEIELKPGQETQVPKSGPPAAPGPLAAMANLKTRMADARDRLNEVKKTWTSQTPEARAAARARLEREAGVRPGGDAPPAPQPRSEPRRGAEPDRRPAERRYR